MNIGVLGTGMVGRAHAGKLASLGHDVVLGTRAVATSMARAGRDAMGNPPLRDWLEDNGAVRLDTFAAAAHHGEVLIEAVHGAAAVAVLSALPVESVEGKILIDISNPLDFSKGLPPTLFVSNTDSLAERIQRALPRTKIVKALNTLTAALQVDPGRLAGGDHDAFLCGDDPEARGRVAALLREWYGWRRLIDLGGIAQSRGPEMYLPLWLRLWGALGSGMINVKIVR